MKHLILLFLFFCSVSCSSNAQEQPVPTSSADTIPAQKITLLFAGDLMQHQAQIDAARTATGYDYTDYFKLIKEEIGKADIAIGNLEVTLGGKPYRGYPAFSAPDEYLTAIKDAGFNVLITANNHCLDRGKKRVGKNHPDVGFPTTSICRHLHRQHGPCFAVSALAGTEWLPHCPAQLYIWY